MKPAPILIHLEKDLDPSLDLKGLSNLYKKFGAGSSSSQNTFANICNRLTGKDLSLYISNPQMALEFATQLSALLKGILQKLRDEQLDINQK
ncbi:hypothetical protein PHSC3_001046 [Chlamydiales bacterium STE3]|nr:hypothetical protein PHSC3_001046 [Chlamydiales bacterium STE3]